MNEVSKKYYDMNTLDAKLKQINVSGGGTNTPPYIDAVVYGCKANDDTFDNFSLIKELFITGNKVYFPAGEYYILTDDTITVPSNFELFMDSGAIFVNKSKTVAPYAPGEISFMFSDTHNVTVTNFHYKNWTLPTDRAGGNGNIFFENSSDIIFNGVTTMENGNRAGMMICGVKNLTMDVININVCNSDGVYFGHGNEHVDIREINIYKNGDDGVSIAYNVNLNDIGEAVDTSTNASELISGLSKDVHIGVLRIDGYSPYAQPNGKAAPAVFFGGVKGYRIDEIIARNRGSVVRISTGLHKSSDTKTTWDDSNFGSDASIGTIRAYDCFGFFSLSFADNRNYTTKSNFKTFLSIDDIYMYNCTGVGFIGNNAKAGFSNLCDVVINNIYYDSDTTCTLNISSVHHLTIRNINSRGMSIGMYRGFQDVDGNNPQDGNDVLYDFGTINLENAKLETQYGARNIYIDELKVKNASSMSFYSNSAKLTNDNVTLINSNIIINRFCSIDHNKSLGSASTNSAMFLAKIEGLHIHDAFVKTSDPVDASNALFFALNQKFMIDSLVIDYAQNVEGVSKTNILPDFTNNFISFINTRCGTYTKTYFLGKEILMS